MSERKVKGLFFIPPQLREEIEGDLLQRFGKDQRKYSVPKAKRLLFWNTLKFFRPGIVLRNDFSVNRNRMISHYISLSFRSISRNKIFSLINITGLTVGLIAFFLIIQYVSFETGFDRFHKDADQLYRVVHQQEKNGEVINSSAKTFMGVRKLIYENFPGVTATAFSQTPIDLGIVYEYKGKTHWYHGNRIQADSSFFKVFTNLLIKGNAKTALNKSNDIILSAKLAQNTFGNEDPVHEVLRDVDEIGDKQVAGFEVTGVFQDLPANSHLKFEAIEYMDMTWDTATYYWDNPSLHTYVRVPKKYDINLMQSRLNDLLHDIAKDQPSLAGAKVILQPITEIHLTPGIGDELRPTSDIALPLILSAIALCILFIAWVNYINLETARFVTQAREVGIRRVIGSSKHELGMQHIIRYLVLNVIAFTIAVVGLIIIIPYFSDITGIPIDRVTLARPIVWVAALALYLAGSVVVGLLPALLLLKLNPAAIIKGSVLKGTNSRQLRTSLVVVQYVASVSLIVFVVVANDQLDFIRSANRKIDVEQVIAIENPLAYSENFEGNWDTYPALNEALRTHPGIKQIGMSSNVPGRPINFTLVNVLRRNELDPYNPARFKLLFIDHNYMELYGVTLKAGRSYNYSSLKNYEENNRVIVLNEAAVLAMGFKSAEDAINQRVWLDLWGSKDRTIIGVVEDHYHESVKTLVPPTIYYPNDGAHQQVYFSIRFNEGADVASTIAFIEQAYKKVFPKNPFDYFFVNDLYQKQFEAELHFARTFGLFSGVALFLACLGILGITLFEANTRLKEISIRKVLGASVASIIAILSGKHLRVIIISLLIATPLAFYASSQWLSGYPVRITLNAAPFVIATVSIIVVTFVASIVQTVRAASTNPVEHLKNE